MLFSARCLTVYSSLRQPSCASRLALCQPAAMAQPGRNLSSSTTARPVSEDLSLMAICLPDKAGKRCPGNSRQRLCEGIFVGVVRARREGWHAAKPTWHTHICTYSKTIMDALNGLAMASPLGRRQKQRWHHARCKLGGIDGRYTKRSKLTP